MANTTTTMLLALFRLTGRSDMKAFIPNLTQAELARRNALVRESEDDARHQAAVIFMTNWMKRKGVLKEDLLALGVWSDAEVEHINKIYRYSY